MYYPDLKNLSCYHTMKAFIVEFDKWLAALPNSMRERIAVENIAAHFGVPYEIIQSICIEGCKLNIFEKIYAITCPECEFFLKLSNKEHLSNDMNSIHYCYACEEEDIKIKSSDIRILYKLISRSSKNIQ